MSGTPIQDERDEIAEAPSREAAPESDAQTRRSFLDGNTRRALYLAPVVLSLTARRAMAATQGSTP